MTFSGDIENGQIIVEGIKFDIPPRKGFRKQTITLNGLVDTGATETCMCGEIMTKNGVPIHAYASMQNAQSNENLVPVRIVLYKNNSIMVADYKSCKDRRHACLVGMNLIKELTIKDGKYTLVLH